MSNHYDIIIIGAGPAGMAAAHTAASHGARTLVLDEQPNPGGQIYRAIEANQLRNRSELGEAYLQGRDLVQAFRKSEIDYVPGASVWQLSKTREVGYSKDGVAHLVSADQIIVATGALERPMPIPGWTLPQVMTVGAAQVLLKESEIAIENAVFAGTGPLLYLVVEQYLAAGVPVKAVIDLTPSANYLKAISKLPRTFSGLLKIVEGWRWKRQIVKSGVPLISGVSDLRITGETTATAIEYQRKGTWHKLDCQHVLMHQGVVPDVNLALAAGCAHSWHEAQACWNIDVDEWFASSLDGIAIAGDGASIAGAIAAEQRGCIAALASLELLGKIDTTTRDQLARQPQSILKSEMQLRGFLDTLFRPANHFRIPENDETIVCRCEEITVAQIRSAVDIGCVGPNQLKSYTRCGMGPCQGRLCGLSVSELIGKYSSQPVSAVGYYRLRSPVKPLLLEELANMTDQSES